MSTEERVKTVHRYHYCPNCLAKSHDMRACNSLRTCQKCDKYHHTLLHPSRPSVGKRKGIETKELRLRQLQRHQKRRQQHQNQHQPKKRRHKRHHQHPRQPRAHQKKPNELAAAPTTAQPSTATTAPVMGPIVDAIRSLATILSVTHSNTSSA